MLKLPCLILALLPLTLVPHALWAHGAGHPSVHDTLAGIVERRKRELPPDRLVTIEADAVLARMTEEERHVLGTEWLSFGVDQPVDVAVFVEQGKAPYWLVQEGFQPTSGTLTIDEKDAYEIWRRSYDPGRVGLGVPSIDGEVDHYVIGVSARSADGATTAVAVHDIYPALHTVSTLASGEAPYVDDDDRITALPEGYSGWTLIRGVEAREDDAQLVGLYRLTDYPSSTKPDHIVLTWTGDPRYTQAVQWRTAPSAPRGVVAWRRKADHTSMMGTPQPPQTIVASADLIEDPMLVNDSRVLIHSATITGLEPATTYVYQVGAGPVEGGDEALAWSGLAEFTTAPAGEEPFSFIYMGDAQNGLERWGSLIHNAFLRRPDAAFYIMAGDLVNRGAERDDWDSFFQNSEGIFDRRPVVPAIGNHEYQGGEPHLYLNHFALPADGPLGERAYALHYGNALIVVLDSNKPAESQAAWLDETLTASTATWKMVVYHHPAYSSAKGRNNEGVVSIWGPIFDKHHVDLALQGHDHAYLRTWPMKAGRRVDSPAEGTVYIVSVSGTKFYEQGEFDYTAVGFENTSTYQVLDIQVSGDRLVYKSYDMEGKVMDEFIIEK